ncbi:MAG: alpha/beta hydrolase [Rubrivivax sp.]|nr:alpha/beta hydrolase [Rubrivivax sp.]
MKAALLVLALATGAAQAAGPFGAARFSTVTGAGGVPLNVVELGDPAKPAVLFLHGFRQSFLSWTAQFASDLPQRCRLVAFDLRGHGNSGHPWQAEAYDNAQPWGEDVARVIAALALQKPLIVGWSFGGNVAMDFAATQPQVPVAGYLLVGTAAGTTAAPAPPPAPASAPPRPTASPDLTLNIAAVQGSTDFLFKRPGIAPELRAQFAAAAMRVGPWLEQSVAKRPRVEQPFVPAQPLTFATGEQDPLVTAPVLAKLKTLFPAARFVGLPGVGHSPFLEDPARFNALLDELHCGGR